VELPIGNQIGANTIKKLSLNEYKLRN